MEKRREEIEQTYRSISLKVLALPRRISAGSVARKRWNGNGITKDLVSPSNAPRETGESLPIRNSRNRFVLFKSPWRGRDILRPARQWNCNRNVTRTAVNLVFPASTTKRMARFAKYIDTTLNRSNVCGSTGKVASFFSLKFFADSHRVHFFGRLVYLSGACRYFQREINCTNFFFVLFLKS